MKASTRHQLALAIEQLHIVKTELLAQYRESNNEHTSRVLSTDLMMMGSALPILQGIKDGKQP